MKRLLSIIVVALLTIHLCAQDIIITTDAQKIEAKILEVSRSEIKYKEADNLNGPLFILATEDIHSIIYANGKVVLYNNQEQSATTQQQSTIVTQETSSPVAGVSAPSEPVKDMSGTYHDWYGFLDYIQINKPIDITNYATLYIYPIDCSGVSYPVRSDSRYPALVNALYAFPVIIKEELQRTYPYVDIILLQDTIVPSKEKSAVLRIKINRLEMGERVSTKYQGYGGGVHTIQVSGNVQDIGTTFFSFEHQRISIRRDYYEKILKKEFGNFAEDITRIFETFKKEM